MFDADVGLAVHLLHLVVLEVERHPQQRAAEGVRIGRIEAEVVLPVGHHRALIADAGCMIVVIDHRLLPRGAPPRRAARGRMILDRSGAGIAATDAAAADVARLLEVVAVAVEVIHAGAECAGAHEVVHDGLLVEIRRRAATALIGIVATDDALACGRIVGHADARMQQEVDVAERIGRQDDEVGRLFVFASACVEIGDADGPLAGRIEIDLQHGCVRAQLESSGSAWPAE